MNNLSIGSSSTTGIGRTAVWSGKPVRRDQYQQGAVVLVVPVRIVDEKRHAAARQDQVPEFTPSRPSEPDPQL